MEESIIMLFPHLTPYEITIRSFFAGTLIFFILYIVSIRRKRDLHVKSLQDALAVAEIEKRKFEEIVDVAVDAISVQDLNKKILYQNRTHSNLMGNHLGETCYRAYQKKETECGDCLLSLCFRDGLPRRRETTLLGKNGTTMYVEIIYTPLRNSSGAIVAGIESIRDITLRREIEKNILSLNIELQKKTQELVAYNNNLKTFSYSLSHDLKSPLTIIYSSAQILQENCSEHLDETGGYLLEQILLGGERMDQLLDAMLQMAHHTQIELNREQINLSTIVKEITDAQRISTPGRSVHFMIADGIIREGEPRLIRSVLENLLGNAWKYTLHVKDPIIEFGSESRDGVETCFVRDNGAGFDMQKAEKLFHPFQRLHSQDEFKGNGVGLATAQQIIHRHGGRIWGEAKPGEGATFYFTL